MDKAAAEAVQTEWSWSDEQDAIARQDCIEHGMVIDQLTDEAAWLEAARNVWPDFYDKVGGTALVDKAVAIMNAN